MPRSVWRALAGGAWLAVALVACGSGSTSNPVQPPAGAAPARLLVVPYTTGFRHRPIEIAEATIRTLGQSSGLYQTEFCRTADDVRTMITPTRLANVDALFFVNTTGNLGVVNLQGMLDWIAAGHAFLGAHSASDTYHD